MIKQLERIRGVLAYGIVHGILTVYVDESLDKTEKEDAERNVSEIFDTNLFKICFIQNRIQEFSDVKVGARIGNTLTSSPNSKCTASLAAFATDKTELNSTADKRIYLLMSNHVARTLFNQSKTSVHIFNINHEIGPVVGTLLEPSENNQFDLALAKLERQDLVDDEKTKLKNSSNSPKRCHVVNTCNVDEDLSGLRVHIWGACSSPGFGQIACGDLRFSDNQARHIVVEDTCTTSFSQIGDSGSIVCSDNVYKDCVDAISVLVGGYIVSSDNGTESRNQYITVELDGCLRHLSTKHGRLIQMLHQIREENESL